MVSEKARNAVVFNGEQFSMHRAFDQAIHLHKDYTHCREVLAGKVLTQRPGYREVHIRWLAPDFGWIKCNTDGSVQGPHHIAGCGGVGRDMYGNWLFGFSRNLGTSNVLWTELWAIQSMLQLAWNRRVPKLLVESDSAVAIKLVNEGCNNLHPYASLVLHIRAWKERDWVLQFGHVYREANRVADCLANLACSLPDGTHVYEDAPACCRDLVFFDCMGTSFPRSIRV